MMATESKASAPVEKPVEKPKEAVAKTAPAHLVNVKAKFGDVVDPNTAQMIYIDRWTRVEPSAWIKLMLDEGKLEQQ